MEIEVKSLPFQPTNQPINQPNQVPSDLIEKYYGLEVEIGSTYFRTTNVVLIILSALVVGVKIFCCVGLAGSEYHYYFLMPFFWLILDFIDLLIFGLAILAYNNRDSQILDLLRLFYPIFFIPSLLLLNLVFILSFVYLYIEAARLNNLCERFQKMKQELDGAMRQRLPQNLEVNISKVVLGASSVIGAILFIVFICCISYT